MSESVPPRTRLRGLHTVTFAQQLHDELELLEEELELSDGATPALPIVIALKPLPMAFGFDFGLTPCFFVSFLVVEDTRFFVFFSFLAFFAGLSSLSVSVAPPSFFVDLFFFFYVFLIGFAFLSFFFAFLSFLFFSFFEGFSDTLSELVSFDTAVSDSSSEFSTS